MSARTFRIEMWHLVRPLEVSSLFYILSLKHATHCTLVKESKMKSQVMLPQECEWAVNKNVRERRILDDIFPSQQYLYEADYC